jgi:hypothetical protein
MDGPPRENQIDPEYLHPRWNYGFVAQEDSVCCPGDRVRLEGSKPPRGPVFEQELRYFGLELDAAIQDVITGMSVFVALPVSPFETGGEQPCS